MERRDFFRNSSLATAGFALSPLLLAADDGSSLVERELKDEAKNIIFLVSDGMSSGTLNMADLFSQRTYGKHSTWIENYKNGRFRRSMMDTASASSIVTDSAAGGSAWGGGKRVPNGSLNVGANGEEYTPILQKFKNQGKKVGCVTTVPITHATPASFCVNNKSRRHQDEIAVDYKTLKFDVMMGGGHEHFDASLREDGRDLYADFTAEGFDVVQNKQDIPPLLDSEKPLLGVFQKSALPYTLDQMGNGKLIEKVPSLSEMLAVAIDKMKDHKEGFVLQVEGGKVDWAAHSNDSPGLIYDQIAFDQAVKRALDFAIKDKNTLVIVTTDHGNGNPGLFYGTDADKNFDRFRTMKQSNKWVMDGLTKSMNKSTLKERIETAQGYVVSDEDAQRILQFIENMSEEEMENDYKKPFELYAQIQKKHTNVGWGGMKHSADFVELAAFGPGSELLPPFVKNTFLHNMMLKSCGKAVK
jgi:alkaline phosphatase